MPSITMTAPSDMTEGSIIKAYDGEKMVNVCVPSDVQKGDQFNALIVGPSEADVETPTTTVKASPVSMTASTTENTTASSPQNINVSVTSPTNSKGRNKNKGMAVAGMVCGIIGLFFFGIVLGPLAIIFSCVAKSKIKENPEEHGGNCQANAGLVLGIVDVALWAIIMAIWLGA